MQPVDAPFDVVITTNSGYPLDQNLYQAVKGMSAAAEVVVPGGTIVCAAECRDGLPDHGTYASLLASEPTPAALMAAILARSDTIPDQWQVQVQARVQRKRRSCCARTGSRTTGSAAHTSSQSPTSARPSPRSSRGTLARLCVLPQGPQTIPYLVPST